RRLVHHLPGLLRSSHPYHPARSRLHHAVERRHGVRGVPPSGNVRHQCHASLFERRRALAQAGHSRRVEVDAIRSHPWSPSLLLTWCRLRATICSDLRPAAATLMSSSTRPFRVLFALLLGLWLLSEAGCSGCPATRVNLPAFVQSTTI